MSNASKRTKTESPELADLDAVREFLLTCPARLKQTNAFQVALEALEREEKRIEREAKLKLKFAGANLATTTTTGLTTTTVTTSMASASSTHTADRHRHKPSTTTDSSKTTSSDHDPHDDEWQDVPAEQDVEYPLAEGSWLGQQLAQAAITSMAQAQTKVHSPLAAVALALHAALRSDHLQFACTGLPEDTSSKGGFAPPIRELPKTQLVPHDWDKHATATTTNAYVALRYRKNSSFVGSVVLRVTLLDTTTVQVQLSRSGNEEPSNMMLTFAIADHINLESLTLALTHPNNMDGVVPVLHYKALPVLLTNFCNTFDLGVPDEPMVSEPVSTTSKMEYVDITTVLPQPPPRQSPKPTPLIPSNHHVPPSEDQNPLGPYNEFDTPTIDLFHRNPNPHGGDFGSDLLPTINPRFPGGGNLMGPNHPAFGSGGGVGTSGFGMRPRFDFVGPPGGPTDPNFIPDPNNPQLPRFPARGRDPPGGLGDPNPDHARPPNDLRNNMFM